MWKDRWTDYGSNWLGTKTSNKYVLPVRAFFVNLAACHLSGKLHMYILVLRVVFVVVVVFCLFFVGPDGKGGVCLSVCLSVCLPVCLSVCVCMNVIFPNVASNTASFLSLFV